MTAPNCYTCRYRVGVPGDAHSECRHPAASLDSAMGFMAHALEALSNEIPNGDVVTVTVPASPELVIGFLAHGIRRGWVTWPLNYDPTWLRACSGWKARASQEQTA